MNEMLNFIYKINEKGIFLWLENGLIKYRQYKECDSFDQIISEIKLNKDEIIKILEFNKIYDVSDPSEVNILRGTNKICDLSYAQERMRFIEVYNGGTNAYNITGMMYELKITEKWQEEVLEKSINSIVDKHEILRTLIKQNEYGIGYQEIKSLQEKKLEIKKLRFASEEEVKEQMEKDANHIYNLSQEYPIKVGIYRIDNKKNKAYLSIVIHHIAFDGWSVEIFLKELKKYYKYYALNEIGLKNQEEKIEAPKIQYKDFALWQKNLFQGERLKNEISYWKEKLKGYEALKLPTDRARPNKIDYKGKRIFFEVNEEDSLKLRMFSRELGVSLYSLLLAGYCLMLGAYSGQDDIVIGTPVSNRHYKCIEDVIGLFVNTLVLRVKLRNKDLVIDYIKYVADEVIKTQLYQNIPFEKIVEEVQEEKDVSKNPIFQTIFALESSSNIGDKDSSLDEFDSIIFGYYTQEIYNISKFDLSTYINDGNKKLTGNTEYAASLFDENTIRRFINTYIEILKYLSDLYNNEEKQSYTRIENITYLAKEEIEKIVYKWNITETYYPETLYSIVDLVEDKSLSCADHIAIIHSDMNITYSELNRRANKLANYLLEEGIGNEDVVAICLEKSFDVVIAILAVLKSGGAYLPIDVDCPEERFNYIIQDSKAKILITKVDILSKFQNIKCKKLFLDQFNYQKYNSLNLKKTIIQKSLCYIIYTSGSTGQPKGVLIQHDGMLNTLLSINKNLGVNKNDKILALSKLTFDLSVYDILGILISGTTIIIPDSLKSKDAEHWSSIVNKHGVTIWNTVPQLAKLWQYNEELLFPERKYHNRIRLFLLSGDIIQINLPDLLKNICSKELDIRCLGGATEASIWSIWHKKDDNLNSIIPYGKPMPNQYIYILDKMLNPVPIGVIGEIYIGGIGIARGYLSKPELTAEKFIANSFCKKSIGERIYKTGDIGKFLEDGTVIFIGRDDGQVKIRGYRIELREIEVILSLVKNIKQSFVTIESDSIVAYIVLKKPIDNIQELLKQACKENLPDYMIPKHIIILDQIPITENGKIDKKQLVKPYKIEDINYEEPKNGIEKTLANIWMDLLKIDKIGRKDNFFKIGGDSILSIQMVSRARKNQILLSVKQIFDTPTIEELAYNSKIINFNSTDEYEQGIVRLLPIQKWFFDNYKVLNHFNQASWFITEQEIDLKKLEDAINKIRYHHDSFRLRFKKKDSKWIQYYDKDFSEIKIQIEVNKLSEAEMINKINSIHKTLDISNGPIDYVLWFNGYGLLWIIHHLIVDSVSWRILLDDINLLYSNSILPSKTSSYKFWSDHIYEYNDLDQTYEFYSKLVPSNVLFKQYKIDDVMVDQISINFSQEITSKFIKEAHECYNTKPNDLLLAALKLSIGDVTGNYNISIDLEGHGRENLKNEVDLSRTIGWFTSIYPVNINISNPENLSNAIIEIKEGLKKIPYKGLTYGIALMNGKIKNQNSSILFNYLGQFNANTKNDGLFRFGDYIKGDCFDRIDSILYDLEINGVVNNNILSFWWKYNNSYTEQIVQIIDRFKIRFVQIVEHCINKENYNYTISDFDTNLDQDELNYITSLIEKL